MQDFFDIAEERGFIHACSNNLGLRKAMSDGIVTGYIGYDATAKSLHVGHLLNIMLLRWFQKCGHRPLTLMGGGTTKVGDPSFRDKERPLLDDLAINRNISTMQTSFGNFLEYADTSNAAKMVNNADWLDDLNYLGFLREIGSHFSVNRMLSFDSVRGRLDKHQSLSFLEFNYMILQAYDFFELHDRFGCVLQMGGSDQWGNIVNGIELVRRIKGEEVFALTTTLVTGADGRKQGKSDGNAVWLDPEMTPPVKYWQYWRNTRDEDVARFLKLFTERDMAEINDLTKGEGAFLNAAKIALANDATALLHGAKAAEAAQMLAEDRHGETATDALPAIVLPQEISVSSLDLVRRVKSTVSSKEAKRLIRNGAVKLNGVSLNDPEQIVDVGGASSTRLSIGKNEIYQLKLVKSGS